MTWENRPESRFLHNRVTGKSPVLRQLPPKSAIYALKSGIFPVSAGVCRTNSGGRCPGGFLFVTIKARNVVSPLPDKFISGEFFSKSRFF
ncbi:MAG TPA: hypothetical protein DEQ14_08475 [Treponema sp.]|nr:hypothetical protein [Treponema sp.]